MTGKHRAWLELRLANRGDHDIIRDERPFERILDERSPRCGPLPAWSTPPRQREGHRAAGRTNAGRDRREIYHPDDHGAAPRASSTAPPPKARRD